MKHRFTQWRGSSVALSTIFCLQLGCGDQAKDKSAGTAGPRGTLGAGGTGSTRLNVGGMGGEVLDGGTVDLSSCQGAQAAKSSIGCDYYALHPLGFRSPVQSTDLAGSCYAAYIANTSPQPVEIRVEYEGRMLDVAKFARIPSGTGPNVSYAELPEGKLPSQQMAILFLSSVKTSTLEMGTVACPPDTEVALPLIASAASDADTGNYDARPGSAGAFHITTSAPVVAYDIFPYGGGSTAVASASLLLPTTSWGTNYIGIDAYEAPSHMPEGHHPWLAFVAAQDNTEVSILPTADIAGGNGVPSIVRGHVGTFSLRRGESLRIVQPAGLSGSVIESNHQLGMWGGSNLLLIPNDYAPADLAHQQVPPVSALGSEYVAVRYRNRYEGPEEAPPWRLLGVVPGTVLSYEPARPEGAPQALEPGQLVTFFASGPFVVRSQNSAHPFYMSAHMTGCTYAAEESRADFMDDCRGDPEFVGVVPSAQFLSKYVFFTDPTYPETNLVVVRKKSNGGFADVSLDCAGTLTDFRPITPDYEYARIDLVRHNFEKQGNCDNGRHLIESEGPFGVTVWGWGSGETKGTVDDPIAPGAFYSQAVSYAYPAGAGVAQVNEIELPVVK